ncbi:ionotropic receptor 25a-like [Parasteatoda tepidariorum]|uniref:ionotropic receptor 25a-like n=1 Tax=Parasteatoda tepidariorum TaxID=114398 RepID=UPI0039BCA0D7
MSLSEMLVLIVLHLRWKNVFILNSDYDITASVVKSLNSNGILVISFEVEEMDTYQWPVRFGVNPPLDGFIAIVGSPNTANYTSQIVQSLKKKSMVNSSQLWIFGLNGLANLGNLLDDFEEGDQVLIVGNNIFNSSEFLHPDLNVLSVLQLWSLHSIGNGNITFQLKILNESFENCTLEEEPLFDKPFTNFGGRILKVSALGSPPIKEPPLPGKRKWRGYIFRVINILGDMFNFTYVVKEADNRDYGMQQEDGTWTGMIRELIRKTVDIGTGDISWTLQRNLAVDLTHPIFPETVSFIYRAPAFYSRAWILFQDIDFRVWISLSTVMIAGSCAYCFILYFEATYKNKQNRYLDKNEIFVNAAIRSISSLYRSLLGQAITRMPQTTAARTILGTWLMGALILSALYGGSLTSRLSLHKSPSPADNLLSLVKRYPNALLALRNNSQVHSYFKGSDYWRKLWLKNMKDNVIPGKYHIEDTMKRVHEHDERTPIYAWIADRSMLVKQMHKYSDDSVICDLYVAKDGIVRSDWSIALVKNSPFLRQFNDKIIRMERFGLLQKWYKDHWESAQGDCRPSDGLNPTGLNSISLTDTQSNFVVLALGWCTSFLLLLIERIVYQWENHITRNVLPVIRF